MTKKITAGLFMIIATVAIFSCKDDSIEKQRQNELEKLREYMRTHHAGLEPKPSGLYYIELEEGTGDSIRIGDKVQIFYDIWTLDSLHLMSSGAYEPLELIVLPPNNLSYSAELPEEMRALHEALTYMKKHGRSLLIFDSGLGFGQYGTYGIAGFTPLRMEVEVYKVYSSQQEEEEEEE